MASLSCCPSPSACITSRKIPSTTLFPIPTSPLLKKPSRIYVPRVSCKASNDHKNHVKNQEETFSSMNQIDRRNMLIGLGGLYGASNALTAPILPPDISKRHALTDDPPVGAKVNCCPPVLTTEYVDFQLPPYPSPLRTRPAAHLADEAYIEKYNEALAIMKALPKDDPLNFYQQANVHCAYCNGAYNQIGCPVLNIQVHHCWLFLPWHRWYLYFYERILGSLIKDPNFAIPFWNWDAPRGMRMPEMFVEQKWELYDQHRNQSHLPPTIVDLSYSGKDQPVPDWKQIELNLNTMYTQVANVKKTRLFYGSPYRAGDKDIRKGQGSLEVRPHNNVHNWTGDPRMPNYEDMGHFHSAARDPIFYAHHANIDRIWSIWKTLPGRKDFKDSDWYDSGFLFYDEKRRLVRVKVSDALNEKNLGYTYQEVDIPWKNARRTPFKAKSSPRRFEEGEMASTKLMTNNDYPKKLSTTLNILVTRPRKSRNKREKEEEEEVLVIENIQYDPSVPLTFDVLINDDDENPSTREKLEFAGRWSNVPHSHSHGDDKKRSKDTTNFLIGINELLEDLGADDDEKIVVTLVPIVGNDLISIGGVKIDFVGDD